MTDETGTEDFDARVRVHPDGRADLEILHDGEIMSRTYVRDALVPLLDKARRKIAARIALGTKTSAGCNDDVGVSENVVCIVRRDPNLPPEGCSDDGSGEVMPSEV